MFASFEGIEGSGKSTLVTGLADRLRASGTDAVVTYEPGGTPLGNAVREVLLDRYFGSAEMTPMAEAFLMNASRAELVARVIRPALHEGRVVLCDRYTDSTLAYQGYGRGLDLPTLRLLCLASTGGLEPDLTFLLDVPVDLSHTRMGERGNLNRLDRAGEGFLQRAREGYLALAKASGRWSVLDATLPANELLERAWTIVRERVAALA
ncbi:MAG: dTMP kinase [Candidatus Tyrphobacter sp.]